MKLKRFNQLNENNNGISVYDTDAVWVVYNHSQTDINEIYLNKKEAENIAEEKTEKYYHYNREINKQMSDEEFKEYFKSYQRFQKYEVINLYNAIELIKDQIMLGDESDNEN